jgi:hypothetical protein
VGRIITLGHWPPTNGWFALFAGLAGMSHDGAGPSAISRHQFPGRARFVVTLEIILLGRLALKIQGRGTFLPDFH